MMPVMTMVFNVVGLVGAYLYSIYLKDVDLGQFMEMYTYWTDPKDYIIGGIKAFVFGGSLSLAACYQGFNIRGGAKEVGLATTRDFREVRRLGPVMPPEDKDAALFPRRIDGRDIASRNSLADT